MKNLFVSYLSYFYRKFILVRSCISYDCPFCISNKLWIITNIHKHHEETFLPLTMNIHKHYNERIFPPLKKSIQKHHGL